MTICIVVNAICASMKDYAYTRLDTEQVPYKRYAESISGRITYIFFAEFILKVIALGFITEPGTYIRDGWNKLDFIVVFTGYDFPKRPISNYI